MTNRHKFIVAVLGVDGARALEKAAERSAELGNALLPRTIMAWLDVAIRSDYEGELPGVDNTYLSFKKSESGFDGSISIEDEIYKFEQSSVYHLAASIAVALGVPTASISAELRDLDIARLGKSIDLLAKARIVAEEIEKVESPGGAAAPIAPGPAATPVPPTPTQKKAPKAKGAGAPATKVAKPQKPITASTTKPATTSTAIPKLPKLPAMNVTKSQAKQHCSMCGLTQFKAERFTGCLCFRDLAKYATSAPTEDGYVITFRGEWDNESVLTLAENLGKK